MSEVANESFHFIPSLLPLLIGSKGSVKGILLIKLRMLLTIRVAGPTCRGDRAPALGVSNGERAARSARRGPRSRPRRCGPRAARRSRARHRLDMLDLICL